jgi:hypothetical protein
METIHVHGKTNSNGILHIEVPLGRPDVEYEVELIAQPVEEVPKVDAKGWPEGYFERVVGAIKDETFERHPQGDYPKPVEFD